MEILYVVVAIGVTISIYLATNLVEHFYRVKLKIKNFKHLVNLENASDKTSADYLYKVEAFRSELLHLIKFESNQDLFNQIEDLKKLVAKPSENREKLKTFSFNLRFFIINQFIK